MGQRRCGSWRLLRRKSRHDHRRLHARRYVRPDGTFLRPPTATLSAGQANHCRSEHAGCGQHGCGLSSLQQCCPGRHGPRDRYGRDRLGSHPRQPASTIRSPSVQLDRGHVARRPHVSRLAYQPDQDDRRRDLARSRRRSHWPRIAHDEFSEGAERSRRYQVQDRLGLSRRQRDHHGLGERRGRRILRMGSGLVEAACA